MTDSFNPDSLNVPFVEQLYADYLRDAQSLTPEWRRYFESLELNGSPQTAALGPSFRPPSLFNSSAQTNGEPDADVHRLTHLQDRVDQLIRSYRSRGHTIAHVDPLGLPRPCPPELEPSFYGFTDADMTLRFSCETVYPHGPLTLAEIIQRLQNTYCRSIGVQYMHIDDLAVRRWLQSRMEVTENRTELTRDEQLRILTRLTDAVTFEEFIRKKFVGAKSFSLEGSESLIPLLDMAIEKAGEQGIDEIVLGMAHRGRLNVLANIMHKHPRQIFREFADLDPQLSVGGGDVKYHLGYSNEWQTATGRNVHLSLCFNPSHLEYVNTVAMGRVRAKQDRVGDSARRRGLTLLIHGDAAFAGEGAVQETLNLSQLEGYHVGGTLHVLVNNQLGFTTGPKEARSSHYATDVAKMLQIPIFHVNGEDPEAVAQVVRLALEFRHVFKRDVVIDMYGYRRLGHNEGDEPAFTQPVLYQAIRDRKSVRAGYLEHLLQLGGITQQMADAVAERSRQVLEKELSEAQSDKYKRPEDSLRGVWSQYCGGWDEQVPEVDTTVDVQSLTQWLQVQTRLPEKFTPHPKIRKFLSAREAMANGEQPLDWSAAEALALASLACSGYRVRMSGQDTARGTFSQRHATLQDYSDGRSYVPLQHLCDGQAPVEILNSPLSEVGVLGFEYGYSLDYPDGLIAWEAQFGDFWNCAQVIVDQFIASAEDKWRRLSGLVLLLPHGFEGQGPEHSSARLERFLMLAAEDNIQVVYPSTPAQYFHVLRRQTLRRWRKPLVIMTPKSLLRHPKVVSTLEECATGSFRRILPDVLARPADEVKRVILCTGKIYYELDHFRGEKNRSDVALIRLEQLYPLADQAMREALEPYANGTETVWVQEEPENMGAWRYLRVRFGERLLGRFPFRCVSRPASASPATGSHTSHKLEQAELVAKAFEGGEVIGDQ